MHHPCKCHNPTTCKWFMAVAPYERGRYGGDARPCSALYPSKAALKRNCDMKGWELVVVELTPPQSDAEAD